MNKIIIAGAPKVGKTTLAELLKDQYNCQVQHTDDLIGKFGWGQDSEEVSKWFDKDGPWIIEGVTTVRALRKWMDTHNSGKPCDVIFFRMEARKAYEAQGQASMAKGIQTVWASILADLVKRGVRVETF